ncbi:MAG: hypothetical protein M1833_002962 [Piccolia ochrophora]|nr:MAG: hypothetical protein M1833_002962 [Piccolia ochrophora]
MASTPPVAAENDGNDAERGLLGGSDASTRYFPAKAVEYHRQVPYLRKLPLPVIGIILLIAIINAGIWVAIGVLLRFHGQAIDLMTRRLIASGQRPVTVGMFFSLGHSTIVIITSIVVAATAAAVSERFDRYSRIGGIIGTSVSASFLIILGVVNMYILYKLIQQMKKLIAMHPEREPEFRLQGAGCLFQLFRRAFKLIDRPWKMYPLGVLFGLGFDTSSEVALLGIASIQAAKGTSIWLILIFPVLFTAGMCLLDTTDGALMMTLYTSTALARDQLAILYYSIVLTVITVIVALVIGVIQLLNLVLNVAEPKGRFWDGVEAAGDHYDIVGGAICASFIVFFALSVLTYRPWRRHVDAGRRARHPDVGCAPTTPASVQDSPADELREQHGVDDEQSGSSGLVEARERDERRGGDVKGRVSDEETDGQAVGNDGARP